MTRNSSKLLDNWASSLIENHKILQYGAADDSSKKMPSELYHYTSLEGVLGIIQSGEIWANHIKFTNDENELDHGREIVRSELALLPEFENIFTMVQLDSMWSLYEPYVFSLTGLSDRSGQWKSYGAEGYGAALAFSTKRLHASFVGDERYALLRVRYEEEDQKRQVRNLLRSVLVQYRNLKGIDYDIDHFRTIIYGALLILCLTFKSSSHHEEQEYRLIYYKMSDEPEDQKLPVNFRSRFGRMGQFADYILPYVKIPISSLLPINELILGSRLDFNTNKDAFLMIEPSLSGKITPSETKIRF